MGCQQKLRRRGKPSSGFTAWERPRLVRYLSQMPGDHAGYKMGFLGMIMRLPRFWDFPQGSAISCRRASTQPCLYPLLMLTAYYEYEKDERVVVPACRPGRQTYTQMVQQCAARQSRGLPKKHRWTAPNVKCSYPCM